MHLGSMHSAHIRSASRSSTPAADHILRQLADIEPPLEKLVAPVKQEGDEVVNALEGGVRRSASRLMGHRTSAGRCW